MSVAQDFRRPATAFPIIFLTARPRTSGWPIWAGATATVSDPIDPIILRKLSPRSSTRRLR